MESCDPPTLDLPYYCHFSKSMELELLLFHRCLGSHCLLYHQLANQWPLLGTNSRFQFSLLPMTLQSKSWQHASLLTGVAMSEGQILGSVMQVEGWGHLNIRRIRPDSLRSSHPFVLDLHTAPAGRGYYHPLLAGWISENFSL